MSHKTILTPKVFQSAAPFSQATITSDGKWIQVSGQVAIDETGGNVAVGDPSGQAIRALENMKNLLESAGAKMSDVCRMVVYVTDRSYFGAVLEARKAYFKAPYPANTALVVAGLANPDWLVEIEATAYLG